MEAVRETSGITLRAIVGYVRAHGAPGAVDRVLAAAGGDAASYEDARHWWSYDQKIAMFEAVAAELRDERVAERIGQEILSHSVGTAQRLALTMAGGPGQLLRLIAKANAKFSTAADMRALRVGRGEAVVEYRLRDRFRPSRFDCDYTRGLLSQVPATFGLPPAAVSHETCQVLGADACRYEVRWRERTRLRWWRREAADPTGGVMAAQLGQLQRTVAELVAAREPGRALATVAAHAGYAVNAQAFLLAARAGPDRPLEVHGFGLSDHEMAVPPPTTPGPGRLVAAIASPDHAYGHLVAFGDHFLDTDRELLTSYANLAAVALDALSALDTAASRQRTAESLLTLARELARAGTPEEVAQVTVDAVAAMRMADRVSLVLTDAEQRSRIAAHSGWPPEYVDGLEQLVISPDDSDELTRMLTAPQVPQIHDRGSADAFTRQILDGFGTDGMAIVGITLGGRLYGALVGCFVGPDTRSDCETFIATMTGVADQAATVLRTCELLHRTWQLAHLDALTGVPNRRAFLSKLSHALDTGRGALLFIDLDGFKDVNDQLGHAAGDELLAVVARRLTGAVRDGDLVARLAGDEFVVLARGVGADQLGDLRERVAAAFAEPVRLGDRLVPVRASTGATLFTPGEPCEDVLHRADAEMYAIKRASRSASAGVRR